MYRLEILNVFGDTEGFDGVIGQPIERYGDITLVVLISPIVMFVDFINASFENLTSAMFADVEDFHFLL